MPTVISATEAKNRFGEVIRRVYRDGETFIVERDGLPVVMIVPVRETVVGRRPPEASWSPEELEAIRHRK